MSYPVLFNTEAATNIILISSEVEFFFPWKNSRLSIFDRSPLSPLQAFLNRTSAFGDGPLEGVYLRIATRQRIWMAVSQAGVGGPMGVDISVTRFFFNQGGFFQDGIFGCKKKPPLLDTSIPRLLFFFMFFFSHRFETTLGSCFITWTWFKASLMCQLVPF